MSFSMLRFVIIFILLFLLKPACTKERLAKLKPSDTIIGFTGCYVILTTILDYITGSAIYWYVLQFITAIWLISYAVDANKQIPSWKMGRCWLISIVFCLPINVLWHWLGAIDPPSIFTLALSAAHLSLTLFVLPLYISIKLVTLMLLVIVYAICYKHTHLLLSESGLYFISMLGLALIIFSIIAYNKRKLAGSKHHDRYLKNKIKEKQITQEDPQNQKVCGVYSDLEMVRNNPKGAHAFIDQIMQEVTQFIAYLDDKPLYKEDLDVIMKNFIIWDIFLKQRARSKNHIILLPVEISLDELVRKLEVALELESREHAVPKLLIESKDDKLPKKIICDVSQMVCLLTPIVLSIANLNGSKDFCVKIQLYTTYLNYALHHPYEAKSTNVRSPAIALVIGNATLPEDILTNIRPYYEYTTTGSEFRWHSVSQKELEWRNIEKRTIEQIVRTHYGYLQFPPSSKKPILIVVPCDVTAVRDEMIARILPSDDAITHKEYEESMVMLTKAYNNLCTVAEMRTIVLDELFLLVRRCYGFRRHVSGQLFYIRALGIAQLVAEWVPAQPRPVYFSLIYGLVRYAGLPLAYVKANYSVDVYSFVERTITVNNRQEMEPCGLYVGNRLKRIINREQLFVLCVKFAERLYDLRHAKDYIHLEEVKNMARETLTVDIELGKKYLNARIVEQLVEAANKALQFCEGIC